MTRPPGKNKLLFYVWGHVIQICMTYTIPVFRELGTSPAVNYVGIPQIRITSIRCVFQDHYSTATYGSVQIHTYVNVYNI